MDANFPGTVIKRQGKSAEEFLSGLFFATKGIMLLQVREITGLDSPVIQNWINRGWVKSPDQKRYSSDHLSRIMMINMLRDVLKLDDIANIFTYIIGDTNSEENNTGAETLLYIYICDILDIIDYETIFSETALEQIIEKRVNTDFDSFGWDKKRLTDGIKIILTYYAAVLIKTRADRRAAGIIYNITDSKI